MANPSPKTLPSIAYLRQCLDYDPATGIFRWRVRPVEHFPDVAHSITWNKCYARKAAGHINPRGYQQIRVADRRFMAHRLAWLMSRGQPVPSEIDHIDGNRSNNRIENLRAVTRAENLANARRSIVNTSGAKGIGFDRLRGKFTADITHNYKYIRLGRFDTFEEALAVRRDAAERLQGKFSRHD